MSNAPKTSNSSSSNNLEKKPDKSELEQIVNDPSDSSVEAVPERPLAYECQRCDKKFASVQAYCGHQNAHKPKPALYPRCGWTRAMLTAWFDPRFYGASASGPAAVEGEMQTVAYTGTPIYTPPLLQAPFYSHLVPSQTREPNCADLKREEFSGEAVMVNPIHACASKGDQFLVPETRAPNWTNGSRATQSDKSGLDLSLKLSCALLNGGTTKRYDFEERDDSGLDLSLKL